MNFFKGLEKKNIYFNKRQIDAITYINGPLLVAAGPGSGKTSVITARVAYLIQQAKISPSNILVITFTRASANEMKFRFKSMPGISNEQAKKVDFGTFHSTFYKIINSYYGRHIPVLDRSKAYNIVKNILRYKNEPFDDETIGDVLSEISAVKSMYSDINNSPSQHFSAKMFTEIYNSYEEQKNKIKCIDFDDMVLICRKILDNDDKVLSFYREKYKYFLIDEFQDTGRMEMDIIKLLCYPKNNICVVGDDDQCIYGFRGSVAHCLLDFEKQYKQCKTVVLNVNYRSTGNIVNISKAVISNNTNRKEKDIKSIKDSGKKPFFIKPPDEQNESSFIADTIIELCKSGYTYNDIAVLYRTNMQSRALIDEFMTRSIPFNIKDGIYNFFDHWMCKDLTAYLKASVDNNDILDFMQIINKPVRYITRESINKVKSSITSIQDYQILNSFKSTGLKEFQIQRISELLNNLRSIKYMNPSAAVNFIRHSVGYENYISTYCSESGIPYSELSDILDEYEVSASPFNTIIQFLSHIDEVTSMIYQYRDKNSVLPKDGVTLSTIHGAKGLEYACIFIAGVAEGLLPHKKNMKTQGNIEEERRLFYVALTRAKEMLYISSPQKYHGKPAQPSRFYDEILNISKMLI